MLSTLSPLMTTAHLASTSRRQAGGQPGSTCTVSCQGQCVARERARTRFTTEYGTSLANPMIRRDTPSLPYCGMAVDSDCHQKADISVIPRVCRRRRQAAGGGLRQQPADDVEAAHGARGANDDAAVTAHRPLVEAVAEALEPRKEAEEHRLRLGRRRPSLGGLDHPPVAAASFLSMDTSEAQPNRADASQTCPGPTRGTRSRRGRRSSCRADTACACRLSRRPGPLSTRQRGRRP